MSFVFQTTYARRAKNVPTSSRKDQTALSSTKGALPAKRASSAPGGTSGALQEYIAQEEKKKTLKFVQKLLRGGDSVCVSVLQ